MFKIQEIEQFTATDILKLEADIVDKDLYIAQEASLKLGLCKIKGIATPKQLIAGFDMIFNVFHEGIAFSHIALDILIKYPFSEDEIRDFFQFYNTSPDKDPRTQTIIGQCYLLGFGIERNLENAFYWFKCAAIQEYAPAELAVGFCYHEGKGVVKDEKKAVKWYEKGVANAHPAAQNNLAYCYYAGIDGLRQNYQKSFELFEKSANQGYAQGLYNLGISYCLGHGVDINLEKGLEFQKKAYSQGYIASKSSIVWVKNQLSLLRDLEPSSTTTEHVQSTTTTDTAKQGGIKRRLEKLQDDRKDPTVEHYHSARMMPVDEVMKKPKSNLILNDYVRTTVPSPPKAVKFDLTSNTDKRKDRTHGVKSGK